jgi:hypothetical protein
VKSKIAALAFLVGITGSLTGCAFLTPNWGALHPSQSPKPTETTTSTPTPTPTAPAKLDVVQVSVLSSSADSSGIDVVAEVLNVSEDGGRCTLVVSQAGTKRSVAVGAESNVVSSQCFPMHIAIDGFSSGAATFTVSYSSDTSKGISAVTQVDIP